MRWPSPTFPLQALSVQGKACEQSPTPLTPVRLYLKSNPVNKLSGCFLPLADTSSGMKTLLLSDLAVPVRGFWGCNPYGWSATTGDRSLTMLSRLRSPLLRVMIQSLLLPFSCNEQKKWWVRKRIAAFSLFFLFRTEEGLAFKSLKCAWEVDLEGRKLSLVSPLCPLPGLQVNVEELGQFS